VSAPFVATAQGPLEVTLGMAFLIGVAFGWALETAGLGSAKKLVGQFSLTDLTVVKVMFSAIITALLGLFWLDWLGFLDLSRIELPDTLLGAQIVGGCIFGAGFAIAGLCPGTSCVAAASGGVDGVAVVGGLFSGVLLTGWLCGPDSWFEHVSEYGNRGPFTLPQLLHWPQGWVVLLVVVLALAGFSLAERLERRER